MQIIFSIFKSVLNIENAFMKKALVLLLLCFGLTQVQANDLKTDEESLAKLVDSLTIALVNNDEAWLEANLTIDCTLNDPTGQSLSKANIIQAFSAKGIYSLESMKAVDMKYSLNGTEASAAGNIELDGAMATPDMVDVSGTYGMRTNFKKTDQGWKISSITVSQ